MLLEMATHRAFDRHEVGSAKWLWDGVGGGQNSLGRVSCLCSNPCGFSSQMDSSPPGPTQSTESPKCAFPTPILSATSAHAHHGSFTTPWCALHGACRQSFRDLRDQGVTCGCCWFLFFFFISFSFTKLEYFPPHNLN